MTLCFATKRTKLQEEEEEERNEPKLRLIAEKRERKGEEERERGEGEKNFHSSSATVHPTPCAPPLFPPPRNCATEYRDFSPAAAAAARLDAVGFFPRTYISQTLS